ALYKYKLLLLCSSSRVCGVVSTGAFSKYSHLINLCFCIFTKGPPSNADTKEKAKQGIKSFADFLTVLWKPREEEKLLRSIVNDSLQHLLQPKLSRLDYVNKKLELAKVESAKQMFRKQIKEVEREMHDIN
uniref:Uncharacterized protein n=1 Tax=Callorhinchus milii TaxID=7868 RepID=A0A4W3JS12_CALMI